MTRVSVPDYAKDYPASAQTFSQALLPFYCLNCLRKGPTRYLTPDFGPFCDDCLKEIQPAPEALEAALVDMRFARQSHLDWAEHLEAHMDGTPCPQCDEKPYRLTAQNERDWVAKYDRVIALLERMR